MVLLISTPTPSPHAYDQVELYASWTYKPMPITREAVQAVGVSLQEFLAE